MDRHLEQQISALENLLEEQLRAHEKLSGLLLTQRDALRKSDQRMIAELARQENVQVQRIAELEKQRQMLAAELTLLVQPGAAAPLPLAELAQLLPEPQRTKLLVRRAELRQRMLQVQQQSQASKRASQEMARHMNQLVQRVSALCTGVATYGRSGGPAPAARRLPASTFSMTA